MQFDVTQGALNRDKTPLFKQKIRLGPNGLPALENGQPAFDYVPYTFRMLISDVLDVGDHTDTGEIKSKINQIQDILWSGDGTKVELSVVQRGLILDRLGKHGTMQVYGLVSAFIEADSEGKVPVETEEK